MTDKTAEAPTYETCPSLAFSGPHAYAPHPNDPARVVCTHCWTAVLPPITDEQAHALIDFTLRAGKSRADHQDASFSEVDFLAGAMAALQVLGHWHKLPAGWFFNPMSGKPVFVTDRQNKAHKEHRMYAELGPQLESAVIHASRQVPSLVAVLDDIKEKREMLDW